jgi:hypothetical protein
MKLEELIPNVQSMSDEELLQFIVDLRRNRRIGLEGVANGPARRPRREKANRGGKRASRKNRTQGVPDLASLSPEEIKEILKELGVDNGS